MTGESIAGAAEGRPVTRVAADPTPVPRCGDAVKHGPSGEEWLVAFADPERNELSPAGWPESYAKISDCTLIRQCSDEEHRKAVADWLVDPPAERRSSWRFIQVRHLYGHVLAAPPVGLPATPGDWQGKLPTEALADLPSDARLDHEAQVDRSAPMREAQQTGGADRAESLASADPRPAAWPRARTISLLRGRPEHFHLMVQTDQGPYRFDLHRAALDELVTNGSAALRGERLGHTTIAADTGEKLPDPAEGK